MTERLVLVKFGGSLITDKEKEDTIRHNAVDACAVAMKHAYSILPDTHFIVGTGAGSFGHIMAQKYDLRSGIETSKQWQVMCEIHNNVRRLNGLVAEVLTTRALPAFTISPAGIVMARNGVVETVFTGPIIHLLKRHCIPVLHGDGAFDLERDAVILSTEKVLQACLERLREEYKEIIVVYCMDTDGLLDEDRQRIPVFARNGRIFVHDNGVHDVTGSIEGKIKSARLAANIANRVYLISGEDSQALLGAIHDESVGTRVL
jgi:isopentenyl phosphate kinase